jgi:hypothetical protein
MSALYSSKSFTLIQSKLLVKSVVVAIDEPSIVYMGGCSNGNQGASFHGLCSEAGWGGCFPCRQTKHASFHRSMEQSGPMISSMDKSISAE